MPQLHLPYYVDTPFGTKEFQTLEQAQAYSEELKKQTTWWVDKEIGIYFALLFGGVAYLGARHPKETAEMVKAVSVLFTDTIKGVGEITKGIGEMIPG